MQLGIVRTCALSCLLLATIHGGALAALVAYDGFSYPAGPLNGNNGGTGWSGAYAANGTNNTVVETTGLTHPVLPTTGGSVRTSTGGSTTLLNFRTLNAVYGVNEAETWVSLLGRRNGATVANLFVGLSFYNSGGSAASNSEVAIAATNQGAITWRVADLNNGGTTASGNVSGTIIPNQVYFLTALVRWGVPDSNFPAALGAGAASAVYLWTDPEFGTTPTLASADATINVVITNFDKIRLAGQNAIDYSFDEIRIGETFDDVTPFLVPEASAIGCGLIALAVGGLVGCCRKSGRQSDSDSLPD